jgi:long-chain acyl-CoA synthetase
MDIYDLTIGRSGHPVSCVTIKLVNWPEGNYFVTNKPYPQGEVIIGSEAVAQGYYKMEKETKEAFYDEDGKRWFRTGDIAEIHDDGAIQIIDRKKDLVKLQHGEYISLGKVESELKTCQIVENICVYCDSTKTYCIALVQPAEIGLANLAKSIGVSGTYSELCKDPKVIKAATEVIVAYGKSKKLIKFEIPTKIALCEDPWTPDTGLTTAAFKIKRKDVVEKYKNEIKKIYT